MELCPSVGATVQEMRPMRSSRNLSNGREKTVHKERRENARFEVPMVLLSKGLAGRPMVPVDMGLAGMRAVVDQRPELGSEHPARMVFLDEVLDCRVRVLWATDNQTIPLTWTVGLALLLTHEEQQRLTSVLRTFREPMLT